MIFIWGSKRVEKKLGWVAEFCPLCRALRAFKLIRVGTAGHVYYITLGEGKLVGHLIQCGDCGLKVAAEPSRYAALEKRRIDDLELLAQRTFPSWRSVYAGRLALEEQLRKTPAGLTPEQRKALLMEPFALMNPQIEARYSGELQFDKQSGLGCLAALFLPAGLFIYGTRALKGVQQDRVLIAAAILFGIGGLYTAAQLILGRGRFVDRRIVPILARSLVPLNPTYHEIAECLDRCRAEGMRIGKTVKPERLAGELQSHSKI